MDEKEVMLAIGERVRNARRRKKWNQTKLGKEVGMSMNGIAMLERGEAKPRVDTLMKLAAVLDADYGYIVTGREAPRDINTMDLDELRDNRDWFEFKIRERGD